jgi:hypothetical protein
MSGPWEKYAATPAADSGKPWEKYAATKPPVEIPPEMQTHIGKDGKMVSNEPGLQSGGVFDAWSDASDIAGTNVANAGGNTTLANAAGALTSGVGAVIPWVAGGFTNKLAGGTVNKVTESLGKAPEMVEKTLKGTANTLGRVKTLGGGGYDTIMGKNAAKAAGEATKAAGESSKAAEVLKSGNISELEAGKLVKGKEADRLTHEAEISATNARVVGENRAKVLGKFKVKSEEIDSSLVKLEKDMHTERDNFKSKWEPEVAAKEISGGKFQDTKGFKNIISLIDDKINKLDSKSARDALKALKTQITSTGNFAGLDIERQFIGSKVYRDALSPGLQGEVKDVYLALNKEMGNYSKGYGEMLSKWGEAKGQLEILEGAKSKFKSAVETQTTRTSKIQGEAATLKEKISDAGKIPKAKAHDYHMAIEDMKNTNDHTQIASKAKGMADKLLDDKVINEAKYADIRRQIEEAKQLFDKQISLEKDAEKAKELAKKYRGTMYRIIGYGTPILAEAYMLTPKGK